MAFVSKIENLKIIYKEIIDGFSRKNGIFVKHLDELENIDIVHHKFSSFEKYVENGIPSIEEKLKSLINEGEWTAEQEDQLLGFSQGITDNESILKDIIPQQQAPIIHAIEKMRKSKAALLIKKNELLGQTANSFAERDSFNYLIYMSIYRDTNHKFFSSYDDFQELDDTETMEYGQILSGVLEKINNKILSQIACMPFFINPFSYAKENLYFFINRPLSRLTYYQSTLFSLGSRNLGILSNTNAEPPEAIEGDELEKIPIWYDKEYSILLGKRKSAK